MITEVVINKKIIQEYMAIHKLTVREFIAQSGISMTIYYKIFSKPEKIGMRHAIKLAKFLKVSYDELICENNNENIKERINKEIILNFLRKNNLSKLEFCKKYDINKYFLDKILNGKHTTIRMNNVYKIINIIEN